MNKIHVILLSVTVFAVIGFFVLETQQTEAPLSSEVSQLLKNTNENNKDKLVKQQQQAEKIDLPSNLNEAKNDMQDMVEEIKQETASAIVNTLKHQQAEAIIKRSDTLIAKVNKQYNIDTSHIDAIVTPDAEIVAALKSDDPEIQKLEQEQSDIRQEVEAFDALLK